MNKNENASTGAFGAGSVKDDLAGATDSEDRPTLSPGEEALGATSPKTEIVEEEEALDGPRFDPPLYIQRYSLVKDILEQHKITSVVDFGCAECKMVRWMREVSTLESIWLVDVDVTTMWRGTMLIKPLTYDYLVRRKQPLTITMLQGNAAELDSRLIGCQAATLVEMVEHLEKEVLVGVTNCVFGQLRPSLVIITTPNCEFNILFPGFTGFRHWDHKFEWSRKEFQDWCDDVCKKHGYSVIYTGVGDPPPGMSHVGHCSQVAIFTESAGKSGLEEGKLIYKHVSQSVYPVDDRTAQQRLASDVDYMVRQLATVDQDQSDGDCDTALVPVHRVVSCLAACRNAQWQDQEIRDYLRQKYKLSDAGDSVLFNLPRWSSSSCGSNDDETGQVNCEDRNDNLQSSDTELWG